MRVTNGGREITNLARVLGDAADDSVAVRTLLGAIVEVLHDDSLAAGIAALQEHDHFVGLQELHHRVAARLTRGLQTYGECRDGERKDSALRFAYLQPPCRKPPLP